MQVWFRRSGLVHRICEAQAMYVQEMRCIDDGRAGDAVHRQWACRRCGAQAMGVWERFHSTLTSSQSSNSQVLEVTHGHLR